MSWVNDLNCLSLHVRPRRTSSGWWRKQVENPTVLLQRKSTWRVISPSGLSTTCDGGGRTSRFLGISPCDIRLGVGKDERTEVAKEGRDDFVD